MLPNSFYKRKQNKLDFIDRECYQWLIHDAYKEILKNPSECKIIFLYGPGGFGKTSLLKNSMSIMSEPNAIPIYISLEITHRDDKLDILIKFRKALPSKLSYPLFDYAIQFLWNNLNTSQMDTEFIDCTQKSLWQYITSGADAAIVAVSGIVPPPVGIAAASISELAAGAYNKLKRVYHQHPIHHRLDEIKNMQAYEIIELLPELLGTDIHTAYLNKTLVLVVDSYQQYSSNLIDPSSWLTMLVQKIGYGLFIITSRENIVWPDDINKKVISQKLDELPDNEVRKSLKKFFQLSPQLLENIISVTGCIPIYLDLAIKSLDDYKSDEQFLHPFIFKNKEDIIYKFLVHLPKEEQKVIQILAIIKIFNEEIFEYLVKDLNISIEIYRFHDICKRSLIRNVEFDNCFFKTHDVISHNISKLTDKNTIQRIFKSYLTIIKYRIMNNYTNIQTNMLFKHLLSLVINNALSLSVQETEFILDIYFVIKESLLPFDCNDIQNFNSYEQLHDIYYFLKALSEERQSSYIRLDWLNQIQESSCKFGKHIKSYVLMKGYLRALCESCEWLKKVVEEINPKLSDSEKPEWYYGQTKIFFGDCQISYGNFLTGINELNTYKHCITGLIGKENDSFQITRHIAHGYRFNMFLEDAENLYTKLVDEKNVMPTPLEKVYIYTNLCETYCYFKPDKILKIKGDALALAERFNDLKSQGKIFYSLAIAGLSQKDVTYVEHYIDKSIHCNKKDGYIAGQLYAYMAQAYYEYAQYGTVSIITLETIKKIQKKIQVYGYFSLPLAMMQEDYQSLKYIRNQYEWLDYDKTLLIYRQFLDSIRMTTS